MDEKINDENKIAFIRGATTASGNSVKEIEEAVVELIDELISRNNLYKNNGTSFVTSKNFRESSLSKRSLKIKDR